MNITRSFVFCAFAVATAHAAEPPSHWSFQPVKRPAVPNVAHLAWPRNAIDHFILERLEHERLTPSPEIDRATLIRRLKFDLLGLPPTPQEVTDFVRDPDGDAYGKLVERYLASPHFGERWARHWLDAVRFAESDGFETNQPRANAWPYRDWVIKALNDDLPFDRFVIEQLAGDQFGADAATGFLVAGAVDRVKSPDPGLTAMQRADELHDMVATTSSAFLGLTAGCARCHDHKFDPISQADYYGLKAIFEGVQHTDRPMRSADSERRQKEAVELRRQLELVNIELESMEPIANISGKLGRSPVNSRRNIERFAPTMARFVRFTVLATNNLEPCIDELELFAAGLSLKNVASGAKPTSSGDYPGAADIHHLSFINDGRYGNGRSWISNQIGAGWVQLELPTPQLIERIVWARDREGRYADRLATKYRIEVAAELGQWKLIASSEDRAPFGTAVPPVPDSVTGLGREKFKSLLERRGTLERAIASAQNAARAYAGSFTAPVATYLFNRGDPLQPRELVVSAGLAKFGSTFTLTADAMETQRRLALARWIADPRHPLTARVIVNRLWHHHFGTGIVDTPSDFGRNGSRPTHPALLDWLADELQRSSWSLKHVHRLIVNSATYRQSSAAANSGLAADASTRLLWRYPPRRLEAEALRDAVLAVCGNLDSRMGGPGFDLFEPNTNYVKVYNPKQSFGPAEWRRMVYQNKPRMQLDDTFGTFDCPDGGQITPRRTNSTTALQALSLLNGRFAQQQSAMLSERLRREVGENATTQVTRAFEIAFQRKPSGSEAKAAETLVREHGLPALCRALLNSNEFVYLR